MDSYVARLDALASAMCDQQFQPVFSGDACAAQKYMHDYTNVLLAFRTALMQYHFNNIKPVELRTADEAKLSSELGSSAAAAMDAVLDMDRVCTEYGVTPIAGIHANDFNAMGAFIGDYCNEMFDKGVQLMQQEAES